MEHYNQIYENIEQDEDHLETELKRLTNKTNNSYLEYIDMLHQHSHYYMNIDLVQRIDR